MEVRGSDDDGSAETYVSPPTQYTVSTSRRLKNLVINHELNALKQGYEKF